MRQQRLRAILKDFGNPKQPAFFGEGSFLDPGPFITPSDRVFLRVYQKYALKLGREVYYKKALGMIFCSNPRFFWIQAGSMNYYYRSHFTNHITGAKQSIRRRKRILLLLTGVLVLLLPAGFFLLTEWISFGGKPGDGDRTVSMPSAVHEKHMEKHMSGEKHTSGKKHGSGEERAAGPESPRLYENPAARDPWTLRLGDHLEEKTIAVSSGDTLVNILRNAGLTVAESYRIINSLQAVFDPRQLRQGQELTLTFDRGNKERDAIFQGFRLKLGPDREVQLVSCPNLGLMARDFSLKLETRPATATAEIRSSLYQAAVDAEMPIDVLMQVIRAYSFDIDFQRDIRPGDAIEVMYEQKVDDNGHTIKNGSVLYASLHTRGNALPIYRYEASDGEVDFYDADGKSVRKTLMVTPIDGARISSGYGMRRHPIRGYNRMHRGLDFAAPTGTPIMAAGSGVVEYAGRKGSYGHYIRIRHPNEYHTVYAHLSRYASGIRSGARVEQGDIIGYVGATGEATGPHLHYEVHHRGEHVNPATVRTPPGRTLEGEEHERFKVVKAGLQELYASLEDRTKLAGVSRKAQEAPEDEEREPG